MGGNGGPVIPKLCNVISRELDIVSGVRLVLHYSRACWLGLFVGLMAPRLIAAATHPAALATKTFQEARTLHKKLPKDAQAAWQFARAAFDLAAFATNSTQRAEIAEEGIAACRGLLARDPNSAPGHYYLGMDLAQLAQTRGIGALKIVTEMEREFSAARELDPGFDFAGPDRNLGLLYRDAPSLISIGDRSRAKKHLERAVELAPDYPENRLNLLESLLKWSDRNGVKREMKALEEAWPRNRAAFAGDNWSSTWVDWESRRQKIRKRIQEPAKEIESPAHKD